LSFRAYPEETRLFHPSEMQDQADQAEAALISALQINTALNRKAHQEDNYGNLANLYWSQELLTEAGSCYDKALSPFRETGNRAKTRKVLELRDSLQATQP
jgi:tetratricopeptide (TPR) repeat protein